MKDEVTLQLGRRIKTLRMRQDLTQEELARRSKVSIKYLQALEGKTPYNATIVTLNKLANGFGIPVWKLLRFEE